jgi:hypothetical protein
MNSLPQSGLDVSTSATVPARITQDFSAVNALVEHISNRHRAKEGSWRAQTFGRYVRATALMALALSFGAFLILWGLSLLAVPPQPRIIEIDRVIERAVPIIVGGQPASPDATVASARNRAADIAGGLDAASGNQIEGFTTEPSTAESLVNFVIFRHISFAKDGFDVVRVGMQYANSSDSLPSHQWCYVARPDADGVATRITLAIVEAGVRTDTELTERMASTAGTTAAVLKQAQGKCLFEGLTNWPD